MGNSSSRAKKRNARGHCTRARTGAHPRAPREPPIGTERRARLSRRTRTFHREANEAPPRGPGPGPGPARVCARASLVPLCRRPRVPPGITATARTPPGRADFAQPRGRLWRGFNGDANPSARETNENENANENARGARGETARDSAGRSRTTETGRIVPPRRVDPPGRSPAIGECRAERRVVEFTFAFVGNRVFSKRSPQR